MKIPMRKLTKRTADPAPATLAGLKGWYVRVVLGEPRVLGEDLPAGILVAHNHGPGGVHVKTGSGHFEKGVVLAAGETKIIQTRDRIGVAALELRKPATLQFEYTPLPD